MRDMETRLLDNKAAPDEEDSMRFACTRGKRTRLMIFRALEQGLECVQKPLYIHIGNSTVW